MSKAPPTGAIGVTVVVVSYNHSSYVRETLDSIAAQTLQPSRIIVADDASTDESVDVVRRWVAEHDEIDVREVVHQHNTGLCPILNEALELVETLLYTYISGDDRMLPRRLETQVARWRAHETPAAAVYSNALRIDQHGQPLAHDYGTLHGWEQVEALEGRLHTGLLGHNWIPAASVMLNAHSVRRAGGYNDAFFYEDHDLWLRLAAGGEDILCVDQPLVEVRELASSLGSMNFGADKPLHLAARLGILLDQYAVSDEGDTYIHSVVPHLAIRLWRTGERPDLVARALTLPGLATKPRWRIRARLVQLGVTREPRVMQWRRSILEALRSLRA